LGEIQRISSERQVFVPTQQIQQELAAYAPWEDVDVITLSGNGEPTLARNLGEIIAMIQHTTQKPVVVLTNGTLLHDANVRAALAIADFVVVKVDAIGDERLRRINRPLAGITVSKQWLGLQQFRQQYGGKLSIQTMLLQAWDEAEQAAYITQMLALQPAEIQLNTPTRPKPLQHQLVGRGNHDVSQPDYPIQVLKPVSLEVLADFSDRIQARTGIAVRYPRQLLSHRLPQ
jgi:wyosine [tRNA(Phe)-imidazoG37] synthetase (radical SAM superfamily)